MTRRLVLVSGAPGSGKSTLARPLATRLGFPLISKDVIKETLVDALGDNDGDLAASRRLGGAAMELLWALAACAPAAVLEANFRPRSSYEHDKILSLGGTLVEVYCVCGPEETARRFAARAATLDHHRGAHPLKALTPELLAEYDRPMGLGAVIEVDTTAPVDIEALSIQTIKVWD